MSKKKTPFHVISLKKMQENKKIGHLPLKTLVADAESLLPFSYLPSLLTYTYFFGLHGTRLNNLDHQYHQEREGLICFLVLQKGKKTWDLGAN